MQLVLRRAAAALSAARSSPGWSPSRRRRPSEAPAGAGAAGIGDPYFPQDGNGGYDVAPLRRPRHLPAAQRRPERAHDGHRPTATQDAVVASSLDLVLTPDARHASTARPATFAKSGSARARRHPGDADRRRRGASRSRVRYHGTPAAAAAAAARSRSSPSRTRRSPSTSRTSRPGGSRSTTTRGTRRPTTSPSRVARGHQVVGNGTLVVARARPGAWTSWHWRMRPADGDLPRVLRGRPLPGASRAPATGCRGPSRSRSCFDRRLAGPARCG